MAKDPLAVRRKRGIDIMAIFRLILLPASDGDCMLLTWGDDGPLHHMLVDGGRSGTYPALHERLEGIAARGEKLDLCVLTHIDGDHIGGALSYLRDRQRPIAPECVWFNGYRQIKGRGLRSMKQGDDYSQLLDQLRWPLNVQFEEGVVSIETAPGEIDVAGLKIRILSPTAACLHALGEDWQKWRAHGEEKDPTAEQVRSRSRGKPPIPDPLVIEDMIADGTVDTELPNGSSIAFVAEWKGVRVLLTGDAHPDVLISALASSTAVEGGRFRVDLLKASHHGSTKNTSRKLVEMLDCRRLAISTNGSIHGHPDPNSIARFIHFGVLGRKVIYFNYKTPQTLPWGSPEAQERYSYVARYPETGQAGMLEIDLLSSTDALEATVIAGTGCGDAAE